VLPARDYQHDDPSDPAVTTMIERIWIVVAGVMVIVAASFLWRNNVSAAFVTATLGAVAWCLSYRAQIRAKFGATEVESNEPEIQEDSDEE
jgi:hypothetical protein